MRALLPALTVVLLSAGLVSAATDDTPHMPQTERMKACNTEAKDKHLAGDERRHFMSECLRGHGQRDATPHADKSSSPKSNSPGAHGAQAEKMKACNQEAAEKKLHGDDRRHFMSECLKAEKKS